MFNCLWNIRCNRFDVFIWLTQDTFLLSLKQKKIHFGLKTLFFQWILEQVVRFNFKIRSFQKTWFQKVFLTQERLQLSIPSVWSACLKEKIFHLKHTKVINNRPVNNRQIWISGTRLKFCWHRKTPHTYHTTHTTPTTKERIFLILNHPNSVPFLGLKHLSLAPTSKVHLELKIPHLL